jgi:serine/threonine-protein kinase RsbW
MSVESRFTGQARMDGLVQVSTFVAAFCTANQVSGADGLRLTLVVEELFTNTVIHGHGGDSDAPVQLSLHAEPTRLVLTYEDTAPAFDPLAFLAQAGIQTDDDVAAGAMSCLGLRLVVNIASKVGYRREDGRNRLCITMLRQD